MEAQGGTLGWEKAAPGQSGARFLLPDPWPQSPCLEQPGQINTVRLRQSAGSAAGCQMHRARPQATAASPLNALLAGSLTSPHLSWRWE